MADEQQLIAQARALGQAIAAQPGVKAYLAARDAVMKDGDAQRLMKDYQAHVDRLAQLEAERKPIEVTDKHKLGELESGMASNEALKALMRAQADYTYLMTQINQALEEPLLPPSAK
ncbi:MAG: YlbF family regulator [Planctomycetes bacterium]|nr:YlbF family regulator [Planctomycetota bacterium]